MLATNYTCLMMKKKIDAFASTRSFSLPHRSQSWGVVLHPASSVHIALDLLLPKMFHKLYDLPQISHFNVSIN